MTTSIPTAPAPGTDLLTVAEATTMGEVAHRAYRDAMDGINFAGPLPSWRVLTAREREAWESAAHAARAYSRRCGQCRSTSGHKLDCSFR